MLGRIFLCACLWIGVPVRVSCAVSLAADGYHVRPGDSIQAALDAAARNPTNKQVKVHAGIYRPSTPGQALIWFNRQHDGLSVEAVGEVTLTAANPDRSNPAAPSHPAIVNHVVYFGDGISPRTRLRGFRITGAKRFVTTNGTANLEPNGALIKGLFFYADGGGIKVFGRSYPVLEQLELVDNTASPCAGGVSVEHDGHGSGTSPLPVLLKDCVFGNNQAQVTGAAVDLLPGSYAVLSNCLFVANAANTGPNFVAPNPAAPDFTNSAALTVFPNSRAVVLHCTFTGNRNGVDDLGRGSVYRNCLFWENRLPGGFYTESRYDLDLQGTARLTGCRFGGPVIDPRGQLRIGQNVLHAPDPQLDREGIPQNPLYRGIGFRPVMAGRQSLPAAFLAK